MGKFKFGVENNNVNRDSVQGDEANRPPLDNEKIRQNFSIWNGLVTSEDKESPLCFSAIEVGGAQPQVDTLFLNKDWTETIENIRKAAPDSPIRPLDRGANVFMLKANPRDKIEWILSELAHITDNKALRSPDRELLRIKVFDSQGVVEEVESTIEIVAELRKQGFGVSVEVAIPYSNGEGIEPNPYPDEFYIGKILQAARLGRDKGIPNHMFRVSLKDMVGELDAENATRLIGKIIDALKAEELEIPFGLHLHDTGLAAEAYAAAIAVCKEKEWPIAIDTVEGKNTGFASMLKVDHILKEKYQIDLNISEERREALEKMGEIFDEVKADYAACHISGSLTGEDLRLFKIPGGGQKSFENAVAASEIARKLGLSQKDALWLVAAALITVGKQTGEPFAVTPGFQNKQIAAINLVQNMIRTGLLEKGMSFGSIASIILTGNNERDENLARLNREQAKTLIHHNHSPNKPRKEAIDNLLAELNLEPAQQEALLTKLHVGALTPEQIKPLFLNNLSPVAREFYRGEMPAEKAVHPALREEIGKRQGVMTDGLKSDLDAIKESVRQLQNDGLIAEGEDAFRRGVSRAIVRDSAEQLRKDLEKPWLHEPDPRKYKPTRNPGDAGYAEELAECKKEYERACKKFCDGLNPEPDTVEKIRIAYRNGNIDLEAVNRDLEILLKEEQLDIQLSVLATLKANAALVAQASKGDKEAVKTLTEIIHKQQSDQIAAKKNAGEQFVYPLRDRIDIALGYLASAIDTAKGITETRKYLESSVVAAPMPGKIMEVKCKEGETVKKNQTLFVLEAMKMENQIKAEADGVVAKLHYKAGDVVEAGKPVVILELEQQVNYAEEKQRQQASKEDIEQTAKKLEELEVSLQAQHRHAQEAVKEVAKRADENAGKLPVEKEKTDHRGYFSHPLNIGANAAQRKNEQIHIVGNRAGCATKIIGDLEQFKYDVRLMVIDSDKTTPVAANVDPSKLIEINDYNDPDEIIRKLKEFAIANPKKEIVFHPGWGFLSEKDTFVARIETELKVHGVVFAGPPSKPMAAAGNKTAFREVVKGVAEEFNPRFFGGVNISSSELQEFIKAGFPAQTPLDQKLRDHFHQLEAIGGDVRIKAVDGGGGKGIEEFVYDHKKDDKENYQAFVELLHKNVAFSEKTFRNGEMLIEQSINGNTHHIEVQVAIGENGEAIVLGLRNCSAQDRKQKYAEGNTIENDYSPEFIKGIRNAAQKIAKVLAEDGYRGVATIEMLAQPELEKAYVLEANTRLQVEHLVTEEEIFLLTGKRISLPVLNMLLATEKDGRGLFKVLEDEFSFNAQDVEKLDNLLNKRILHLRIVSTNLNLQTGEVNPVFWGDDRWPLHETMRIMEQFPSVYGYHGGFGAAMDPQMGALCGPAKDVIACATRLHEEVFRPFAVFDRTPGTNIPTALAVYPAMFKGNGNFRYDFSTKTTDEMMKAIKEGRVAVVNPQGERLWPGEYPVAPGDMQEAVKAVAEPPLARGRWTEANPPRSRSTSPTRGLSPEEIRQQQQNENAALLHQ